MFVEFNSTSYLLYIKYNGEEEKNSKQICLNKFVYYINIFTKNIIIYTYLNIIFRRYYDL